MEIKNHYIFILLTLIPIKNYGADEKPWYTPYANSVKSWWHSTTTPQHTPPLSVKDKFRDVLQRAHEAENRLRQQKLWHTDELSYVSPHYSRIFTKEKDINEFKKFTQKYAPPEDVIQTIQRGYKDWMWQPVLIEGSPSIYHKGPKLDRIFNAERLNNLIKKEHLNLLVIPTKYIYESPGIRMMGDPSDVHRDRWRVFAEPIKPGQQKPFNLEEVKQVATLMQKSGYRDTNEWNLMRTDDGKIAIIDTENLSFDPKSLRYNYYDTADEYDYNIFHPGNKFAQLPMTDEARRWMQQEFEKTKLSSLMHRRYNPLPRKTIRNMKKYDPEDINFERAKRGSEWSQIPLVSYED